MTRYHLIVSASFALGVTACAQRAKEPQATFTGEPSSHGSLLSRRVGTSTLTPGQLEIDLFTRSLAAELGDPRNLLVFGAGEALGAVAAERATMGLLVWGTRTPKWKPALDLARPVVTEVTRYSSFTVMDWAMPKGGAQ